VSEGEPSSPDDGRHFVLGAQTDYDEAIALARQITEKGDRTAGDLINWAGTQAEALVEQCLDSILCSHRCCTTTGARSWESRSGLPSLRVDVAMSKPSLTAGWEIHLEARR
jgi:hypothetical protein